MKSQRKYVKAVAPYIHPGFLNFKTAPYDAWVKCGGKTAKTHYPIRMFHGFAYRWELPTLWKNKKEARLRFIEPVSLSFDTFPDYARCEIIPMVWDCWPCYFEKMCRWLKKHKVRTAIFTSSQTAEKMRKRFPEMNVMWCPEAVDTSLYDDGKPLKDRTIDVLEFGRGSNVNVNMNGNKRLNYVCTKVDGNFIYDNDPLRAAMGDVIMHFQPDYDSFDDAAHGTYNVSGYFTIAQLISRSELMGIVLFGHLKKNVEKDMRE